MQFPSGMIFDAQKIFPRDIVTKQYFFLAARIFFLAISKFFLTVRKLSFLKEKNDCYYIQNTCALLFDYSLCNIAMKGKSL